MINLLHDAIVSRKGSKIHEDIIKDMVQYTQVHFSTEEEYMKRYEYPFFQNHKGEHDKFTEKALELQGRVEKGGFILPLETLNFLRDWLKNHILGSDKKYSKYFTEHGLI
jgi:hemerythrin